MPNELKQCPGCSGMTAALINGGIENHYLRCMACGATSDGGSIEQAAKMWCQRIPTSAMGIDLTEIHSTHGVYTPVTLSGHTTPLNEADLAAAVREINKHMARAMRKRALHKAQEISGPEEAADWGSLAIQIAEAVLLDLGIGYEDTKEPGADRRRDRLCRLIEPMLQPSDDGWELIETAPKDGQTLRVRRVYKGEVIFEGLAAWRTVTFPAFMNGRYGFEPAHTDTGWMKPDKDKRFPEPTHWLPAPPKGDAP